MSLAVRTAIATSASGVEGIECSPYFVQTTAAGMAMVRLDRIEYPNPFGGVCHWNVVVLLPQDQAEAEKYLEEKVPLIRAAIEEHLVITQVQPQRLEITGVGILPCVFINGHREQE
jgi:hypothetical protein